MANNNIFNPLTDLTISESTSFIVQYRFPRSKKARIRKKWSKKLSNYKPDPQVYQINDKLYAHPETVRRLKEVLDK